MAPVEQVLKDAQLSKGDINEIVLDFASVRAAELPELFTYVKHKYM